MKSDQSWVKLLKADHWMEADGLKQYLTQKGIDVYVPERTSSGSLHGEPDLRLGGYSAVSTGFIVYVKPEHLEEAKALYKKWKLETALDIVPTEPTQINPDLYIRKILFSALFTMTLPLVMHAIGFMNIVKYIRTGASLKKPKFILGCLLLVISTVLGAAFAYLQLQKEPSSLLIRK